MELSYGTIRSAVVQRGTQETKTVLFYFSNIKVRYYLRLVSPSHLFIAFPPSSSYTMFIPLTLSTLRTISTLSTVLTTLSTFSLCYSLCQHRSCRLSFSRWLYSFIFYPVRYHGSMHLESGSEIFVRI